MLHSRLHAALQRATALVASVGSSAGNPRGDMVVPDAPSLAFESALALGRHGAVEELMGNVLAAEGLYGKAVCLLKFLLFELPRLDQREPFTLDAPSARLSLMHTRLLPPASQFVLLVSASDVF